ncbi:MAG: Sjogren's syndrome/scleroderma autoantigen 1 family protein [Thermoprotei archaeon]
MSQASKKIAKVLLEGGKLLAESCPVCSTPLVQLKSGEVYCVNCQKRVVIVSKDEEIVEKLSLPSVLTELEELMVGLIHKEVNKLNSPEGEDADSFDRLNKMLEVLKRIRDLKA